MDNKSRNKLNAKALTINLALLTQASMDSDQTFDMFWANIEVIDIGMRRYWI